MRIIYLAGFLAAAATAGAASAHHGWSWAEADQIELTGTLKSVTISPPHPVLEVDASDGRQWRIELGNPSQTERAGFVEGSAAPGNNVIILGNRSTDPGELRLKAVRITVEGRTYDIYPERILQK